MFIQHIFLERSSSAKYVLGHRDAVVSKSQILQLTCSQQEGRYTSLSKGKASTERMRTRAGEGLLPCGGGTSGCSRPRAQGQSWGESRGKLQGLTAPQQWGLSVLKQQEAAGVKVKGPELWNICLS